MMDMRNDILEQDMKQLFKKTALPGIIGTLMLGLYNFVDAVFVGQFIGPESLGGITLVYSVVLINQAFLVLFGTGSMAVLSIAIGKKDNKTINSILGNLVIVLGLFAVIFSLVVFSLAGDIVQFLGGKNLILEEGTNYLKVLSIGFVFAALGPAINMLFRGEGKIKEAMKILMAGMLLNIILDFVFIYFFKWGVEGAALATIISQAVILLLNMRFIRLGKSAITLGASRFRLEGSLLLKVIVNGSAPMVLLLLASIQQLLMFKFLAEYQNPYLIPLLGAMYRILIFAAIPFAGLGQGLQSVVGINYGAGQYHRVAESFRYYTARATVIASLIWALFLLFPQVFLGAMISDKEMIEIGIPLFRIYISSFIFVGIINNAATFFQALGKGLRASVIYIFRQALFFVPSLILFSNAYQEKGILLSLPVSEILTTAVVAVFLIIEFNKLSSNKADLATAD